jgi:hypothetical protein
VLNLSGTTPVVFQWTFRCEFRAVSPASALHELVPNPDSLLFGEADDADIKRAGTINPWFRETEPTKAVGLQQFQIFEWPKSLSRNLVPNSFDGTALAQNG